MRRSDKHVPDRSRRRRRGLWVPVLASAAPAAQGRACVALAASWRVPHTLVFIVAPPHRGEKVPANRGGRMRCAHRAVEHSPTFRIACCQGSNECAPTACHEPRRTAPSRRSLVHAAHADVVSSSRARVHSADACMPSSFMILATWGIAFGRGATRSAAERTCGSHVRRRQLRWSTTVEHRGGAPARVGALQQQRRPPPAVPAVMRLVVEPVGPVGWAGRVGAGCGS